MVHYLYCTQSDHWMVTFYVSLLVAMNIYSFSTQGVKVEIKPTKLTSSHQIATWFAVGVIMY